DTCNNNTATAVVCGQSILSVSLFLPVLGFPLHTVPPEFSPTSPNTTTLYDWLTSIRCVIRLSLKVKQKRGSFMFWLSIIGCRRRRLFSQAYACCQQAVVTSSGEKWDSF